jgi:hypothetical protein
MAVVADGELGSNKTTANSATFFQINIYNISPVAITGRRPPPPPLRVGKTGKNHLNEEIIPTRIGERFTISNLGHAALLLRCELPL